MAEVGDVNRDGLPDLFVGVSNYRSGRDREGAAFFYIGGSLPLEQTNNTGIIWGARAAAAMGFSVAGAGDVNGDGFNDVIAGAPRYRHTLRGEGGAVVHFGSSTGLVARFAWVSFGQQPEAEWGTAVAGVGDINGDGYDDVLVGAPQFSATHYRAGRVALFFGSKSGLAEEPSWVADGPETLIHFGASMCALGDIDGDGYDEFAVGAPGNAGRLDWTGRVYIYFGGPAGTDIHQRKVLSGEQRAERFGQALCFAGDVNGDSRADLLVAAPFHKDLHPDEGRVYLFLGSRDEFEPRPSWVIDGGRGRARYGWALAGNTDFNRDGLAEIIIGAPYYDDEPGKSGGRVDIWLGSRTGFEPIRIPNAGSAANSFRPPTPGLKWRTHGAAGITLAALAALIVWRWRRLRADIALAAAERERARLARDLHDGLGSNLARLALFSSAAPPATHAELSAVVQQTIDQAAQVVWAINPAHDTLESAVSFISEQAQRLFVGSPIRFRPHLPTALPDRKLSSEVRHHLLLVAQEVLTNALKHSHATEVALHVEWSDDRLVLRIQDNGVGLADAPTRRFGNGLQNIRHRVREIGGEFDLENQPGGGLRAQVALRLPRS